MNAQDQDQFFQTLKAGDKITIVRVCSAAITVANRVILHSTGTIPGRYPTDPPIKTVIYKQTARKKNLFQSRLDNETLLFIGHLPCPFVDSDTDNFSGDCQVNLIGDPAKLRHLIETQNINPAFVRFDKITYNDYGQTSPLYPEHATHA